MSTLLRHRHHSFPAGINKKKSAKEASKHRTKALTAYDDKVKALTAAAEMNAENARTWFGLGKSANQKYEDAKMALRSANEAFVSVDFERFGIFNLKLNPDARIMVAPYLFKNPGNRGQDSTSGCARLTQCGIDVTCTGTLVFPPNSACTYWWNDVLVRRPNALALAPAPANAAPDENPQVIMPQGGQVGDPINEQHNPNFLEVATAVAIPRLAHVPRVEINPALGPFGAYQYSVRHVEQMCQPYAALRRPLEDERLLNPAWQTFGNEHVKSDEERYNVGMRPLA